VLLGDVVPASVKRVPPAPKLEDLDQTRFDWKRHRTLPFAADFLGAAFALGKGEMARDAAEFILASKLAVTSGAQRLARKVLSEKYTGEIELSEPASPDEETSRQKIRKLRKSLRESPRDPLNLMDLAREYVALGQSTVATRPVREALALAPNSRFILRSAARFFLHTKDNEQAHDILREAAVTKSDPWLVAAEIAVASAAGRHPSFVKMGRQFVDSKSFSPSHISELASAIGTLELEAGKVRLMKQLFRRALEKPTENSVAQAAWISRRIGNWGIEPSILATPRSYEASAWTSIMQNNWDESLSAAELWLSDEPFATRPTIFGSWVALTMAPDFAKAERIALYGLNRHKGDFLLLNNLAVSLAYQGRSQEALHYFQLIPSEKSEGPHRPTYLATHGLLRFRLGAPEEGRTLYKIAVSEAKKKDQLVLAVWALLHLAREEYRIDPLRGDELVKEARAEIPKLLKVQQAMASRLIDVIVPR
jgi:tetratricopeptide (TPR) repeat protein